MNSKIRDAIINNSKILDRLKCFVQIDKTKNIDDQLIKYRYSNLPRIVPIQCKFAMIMEIVYVDSSCYLTSIKWDVQKQKIVNIKYRDSIKDDWINIEEL